MTLYFSEKLLEKIENIATEELNQEVSQKISDLKIELAENVEEDKKITELRKTLTSLTPLLKDLRNSKSSRKSTLKRPLDSSEARFSKKARNSIWTNHERLSKSGNTETEPELRTPGKKVSFMYVLVFLYSQELYVESTKFHTSCINDAKIILGPTSYRK